VSVSAQGRRWDTALNNLTASPLSLSRPSRDDRPASAAAPAAAFCVREAPGTHLLIGNRTGPFSLRRRNFRERNFVHFRLVLVNSCLSAAAKRNANWTQLRPTATTMPRSEFQRIQSRPPLGKKQRGVLPRLLSYM